MDDCCAAPGAEGYEEVFDDRFARKAARRYRRKRLTPIERRIVHMIIAEDPTVTSESIGDAFMKTVIIARR